jgi:hypothetical protein
MPLICVAHNRIGVERQTNRSSATALRNTGDRAQKHLNSKLGGQGCPRAVPSSGADNYGCEKKIA